MADLSLKAMLICAMLVKGFSLDAPTHASTWVTAQGLVTGATHLNQEKIGSSQFIIFSLISVLVIESGA